MPDTLHRALRVLGHGPSFKGRERILRLLANPDRHRPQRFTVPFYGASYEGDLSTFIDWCVWFYGAYSPEELAMLRDAAVALRRQRSSVTALDIGANVGHHALFLSGVADRVHAFEPYAPVRAEIERKRDLNSRDNIIVHPVALSDRDGFAGFHAPEGANRGTGTLEDHHGAPTCEIDVRRGDDLLAVEGVQRVDLIKIDVEGHEAAALRGLRETLLRDRPVVLMEISGAHRSGFWTEAAWRQALYPDADAFALKAKGRGYHLEPVDFAVAREVVILPRELGTLSPR